MPTFPQWGQWCEDVENMLQKNVCFTIIEITTSGHNVGWLLSGDFVERILIWEVFIPTTKLRASAKWAKCGQVFDWGLCWEDIDYGGTTQLKQHQERAKDWEDSANLIASEKRYEYKCALKRGAVVGAGLKTHHKQDISVSSHIDQKRGTEPCRAAELDESWW